MFFLGPDQTGRERDRIRKRHVWLLIALILIGSSCGSDGPSAASSGTSESPEVANSPNSPTDTVSSAPVEPLVGLWQRETTCEELVDAFDAAGMRQLAPAALAGNGLVSGSTQEIARRNEICKGAKPRIHSHFFTADGEFGSLDWNGQQVDDGTYKIVDGRTFKIVNMAFRYRITSGDTLTLDPLISKTQRRRALAHPGEFSPALWAVSVAFPGNTWERADCGPWC
jgi:hypothetical protein